MKTGISLILFLFSISVFALPPFDPGDGADSSGGGIAVVCRNPDQTITSVEMLDLYEGRVIYGLNIQAPGKTVPDSLKVIKDKLKVVFKNVPMGKTPAYYIDKAQKDFKLLPPDAALVPVNDGAELVIPTNCTLEQLALYKNNTYLLVNSVLWNQMDDLNKAALFAHEGIYTHERELGDKTSQRSRKIVAHLFSEYDFTSLLSEVPQDANECIAHHEQDLQLIAFQFYKFTNPFQKDEEVLQFTKFRGRYPYSLTDVRTPTWPWADQLGDLYLDVDSPIELFDQLYIRRKMTSSGDVQSYYFQEPDGNYLIKCNKSPQVGEAKLTFNPSSVQFGSVAVGQTGSTSVEITNDGDLAASSISPSDLAEPFSFLGGSYPGTGGTCMATLSAHQKCTIVLAYAPKAMSMSDTTELEFSYNNGTSAAKVHLSLQGAHLAPAVLVISDALNYDYGTQAVGGSTSHVFTVINTGSYQARQMSGGGLASPFSFLGGSYPGTGGTCGSSLNVAAACTVVVAFEPTASGVMSDVLEIGYNDGATKQVSQRQVQGTGANPAVISISDGPAYDFGLVSNSGVVHHTFTLTNSGSISATALSEVGLASPFSMVGGVFPGTGGTCGSTLAAASSCTVVVAFAPTGVGAFSDTIFIHYNDGANTQRSSRDVQGSSGAPALLTISNSPYYNFGTQTVHSVSEYAFTVINNGSVSATSLHGLGLGGPFQFAGGAFPGTGGTCGSTLAAASSCTVVVAFAPTSTGVANDTIQLDYFNGSSTVTTTRDITGTGTLPAVIVISEAEPYNFGTVATGSVREHVFTLTNTGGSTALTMSGGGVAPPYSFAGGSYPGTGGTCGATLVPDGSCTINVSYAPVASSAGDTDSIDIDYYDGSISQTAFRGIIGVAAIPALLSISNGPSYDFGAVSVGQIKDRVFTIINSGGYTASSMMGGGLAKPFSFAGGSYPGSGGTCTASLASGASCTVVVRYAPTQAGYKYNDALSISYDDGVLNQTVERDLTGSSESPAVLELSISGSHNSVFTFPDVTIGKGNPELATITIKNNGATVATLLKAENGFDAPFGFVGGAYPGTGGTCGANLKSQESCTLQVHFAPKTFGHFSDTLAISYYDGSKKQILLQYFEGEGVKPQANPMSQAAL